MRLIDFSIGRRLNLGFAVLLVLFILANAAAIYQFTAIERLHREMMHIDWVQSQTSHFINVATRDNAMRALELLIATERQASIAPAIAGNKLAIDHALDRLTTLVHALKERVTLTQLAQARSHYVASLSRVAELIAQGQHEQATAMMKRETLPAFAALQDPITNLAAQQTARVEARSAEIELQILASRALMLVLAGAGMLFGVAAARLISRSITEPIAQAVQLAQQVACGDLRGGPQVRGHDEMAHLLRSLLDMNASLVSLRMHALLDVAIDAVVQFDAQGTITGWNTQAAQCFGWSQDDAMGKHVQALLFPTSHHHRSLQGSADHWWIGAPQALNTRLEVQAVHRDGREVPIELVVTANETPQGTGYMAFVRDISLRRRAEADSRIAALAFESLEAMVVTDVAGVILKVNQAFTQITGYCKEEVIGKTSPIFRSGSAYASRFHLPRETLHHQRLWQGEVSDRRKNGDDYATWLRLTAVVDQDDVVTHYVIAFVDITENKQYQERIHGLSYVDTLTGLPNRRALGDRLSQVLSGSERRADFGAVLLVDLDNFKLLNDARGREQGDLMLQQVALRIKCKLHADDLLARVDGDSFAIVLSGLAAQSHHSASKARQVAEQIRVALGEPFETNESNHCISSSIGICLFSGSATAADVLMEHAEVAMYKAKHDGRNCIRFYDPATQAALEQRFNLIAMLHKALPTELRLYYQVQVDNTGSPMGAETLVRWQHPKMGLISPAMFIPLAEETGLILPIGAWVLNAACEQLARWALDPATCHLKLAVNVSARQFLEADFANGVLEALARSGANPGRLKLELTESVMVNDADSVIEKMLHLTQHGVRFSLDDFGTGYSSLAYLKRLPLEQLKIDQSFVRNLLRDANDTAIVRAVINLGQSLGLQVIAEGVETVAQRDALLAYGCGHFQGYLFGKPQPSAQFEATVRQRLGGLESATARVHSSI